MNHILKAVLFAISMVLSIVSAYLTASFLYRVGLGSGHQYTYSAAGLVLDAFKTALPAISSVMWARRMFNYSIAAVASCVALAALSFACSYSSFSDSQVDAFKSSDAYVLANDDYESAKSEVETLLSQQSVYLANSMATKAKSLNTELKAARLKMKEASNALKAMVSTAGGSGVQSAANWIFAAAIEISSIASVLFLAKLSVGESSGMATVQATLHKVREVDADAVSGLSENTVVTEDFRIKEVVMMIAKGVARPSERGLSSALNIPRYESQMLLAELESNGVLVRKGRYRVLNPNLSLEV